MTNKTYPTAEEIYNENNTPFTPGEWGTSTKERQPQIYREDGRTIALCYELENDHQAQANARLIAAAPELYEVVLMFIAEISNDSRADYYGDELTRARLLIHQIDNP